MRLLRKKYILLFVLIVGMLGSFVVLRFHASQQLPSDEQCAKQSTGWPKYTCYSNYFKELVHTHGATTALTALNTLQQNNQYLHATCHEMTHVIGNEAYIVYGSVSEATKYRNPMCYDGYLHGIMESYMDKFSNKDLLKEMPKICKPDPSGKITQGYYDCVHGLGHGVTIRFNNDVFKGLPYCDVLKTEFDRQSCYNGAFMQNIVVDGIDHVSVNLKASDPVYPCDAVPDRQKDACYLNQTAHILPAVHNNVAKAFVICDSVETKYIPTCYQSMGRDISTMANGVPDRIVQMCGLGNQKYEGYCYISAAQDAVTQSQNPQDADSLCNKTPTQYKKYCELGKKVATSLQ